MQKQFTVTGMTCDHCENRVAREVSEVAGVEHVTADAAAGTMFVTGDTYDLSALAEAVDEAGYALVDA